MELEPLGSKSSGARGMANTTILRSAISRPATSKQLGATLLRGRYFEESEDGLKPHVAIVNQAFARKYFPGEDPIGKLISPLADPPVPIQIVGAD